MITLFQDDDLNQTTDKKEPGKRPVSNVILNIMLTKYLVLVFNFIFLSSNWVLRDFAGFYKGAVVSISVSLTDLKSEDILPQLNHQNLSE